jgi:hypothetical protein
VRIQPLLSSFGHNPIAILPLDKTKELSAQKLKVVYPTPLNLQTRQAIKLRVKGNGKRGHICIRLHSIANVDRIIDTDFEGWRDFVLVEADNATRPDTTFSTEERAGHLWGQTRFGFKFDRIHTVELLTDGDVEGVRMGDVLAVEETFDIFRNPTVKVGDTTLALQCEIMSGDYIEYDGEKALVYDRYANVKEVFIDENTLRVPRGKFEADFEAESLNRLELPRAEITFGFMGKEI